MTFTYRGQTYTSSNNTIETKDTGLKATYRGAAYSLQRCASLRNHPAAHLTYRGVSYGIGSETTSLVAGGLTPAFG